MSNAEKTTWQYKSEYSYEANMNSWIDAATFERNTYNETRWTKEQAEMKFQEMYPRSEYGRS